MTHKHACAAGLTCTVSLDLTDKETGVLQLFSIHDFSLFPLILNLASCNKVGFIVFNNDNNHECHFC